MTPRAGLSTVWLAFHAEIDPPGPHTRSGAMGRLLQGHQRVVSLAATLIGFAASPLSRPQCGLLVVAASLMVFPTTGLVEVLRVVMAVGALAWVRVQRAIA